jgi:hypothetical protein
MRTKGMLSFKSTSQNKKSKNKNMTHKKKNSTIIYCKEKTKQSYDKKENVPKISVEHIKCKGEFYLNLYLLGT